MMSRVQTKAPSHDEATYFERSHNFFSAVPVFTLQGNGPEHNGIDLRTVESVGQNVSPYLPIQQVFGSTISHVLFVSKVEFDDEQEVEG